MSRSIAVIRLGFWAAALFAFVMAILPHPPELPGGPSDKVQHIAAFLVLGTLACLAYPEIRAVRLGIALSLFGAFIEIVQAVPVLNRDSDPIDWIADTIAAAVALVAARRFRASLAKRR